MNSKTDVYYRFGEQYKKISREDIIQEGAMHSYCNGELEPIKNEETIGDKPSSFSPERDFYNPIS